MRVAAIHLYDRAEEKGFPLSLDYEIPLPLDALKRLQAEIAAELDALLASILDKAFKGEL